MSSLPLNENKNMQVKDNVTGALARMFVVANAEQRNQLAPQFLQRLPLTEDHAEWKIVLTAIELLVQQGNEQVSHITRDRIRDTKFFTKFSPHFIFSIRIGRNNTLPNHL